MKIIMIGALAAVVTLSAGTTTEQEVVAMTILAEARGEGHSGMYAVAAVIAQRSLNRQLSPRRVCLQKKQFSCWNSGRDLKYLLLHPEAKYALFLANNIKEIDRSYVGYADHYHNKKVKPYWSNINKRTKIINNHIFYKLW